jgi:hypothetical protein
MARAASSRVIDCKRVGNSVRLAVFIKVIMIVSNVTGGLPEAVADKEDEPVDGSHASKHSGSEVDDDGADVNVPVANGVRIALLFVVTGVAAAAFDDNEEETVSDGDHIVPLFVPVLKLLMLVLPNANGAVGNDDDISPNGNVVGRAAIYIYTYILMN